MAPSFQCAAQCSAVVRAVSGTLTSILALSSAGIAFMFCAFAARTRRRSASTGCVYTTISSARAARLPSDEMNGGRAADLCACGPQAD